MHYRDLRGWLEGVESFGELRVVEGADWNQEIGALAEVAARSEQSPAVLFDKIKGYPPGRRVLRSDGGLDAPGSGRQGHDGGAGHRAVPGRARRPDPRGLA